MNDISFKCPFCQQQLAAPPDMAGELTECPTCKKTIEIPLVADDRTAKSPPPPPQKPSIQNRPRTSPLLAEKTPFALRNSASGEALSRVGKGYIDSNLHSGEIITHRTKLHWIVLVNPWFLPLVATVMCGLGGGASGQNGAGIGGAAFGAILGTIIAVPLFLIELVRYLTTEYAITNRRVIGKRGFIRRDSAETALTKVEGIDLSQSIIGRLLNYGTVTVTGTGSRKNAFKAIRQPLDFRRALHAATDCL